MLEDGTMKSLECIEGVEGILRISILNIGDSPVIPVREREEKLLFYHRVLKVVEKLFGIVLLDLLDELVQGILADEILAVDLELAKD